VTKAGTAIDVLIKDISLAEAGKPAAKGGPLTASATGTVKKAASGNFILGVALTATQEAGELVHLQITKSGFMAAAAAAVTPPEGKG